MAKIKGITIMIPPILIALVEIYYLIIQPLINDQTPNLSSEQYWALALPVAFAMIFMSVIAIWIGYTMIVTPQPIRFTYEEAYEAATELNDEKEGTDS